MAKIRAHTRAGGRGGGGDCERGYDRMVIRWRDKMEGHEVREKVLS